MIKSLNLALSNRCSAKCVFCPSDRGLRDPGNMSLSLIRKLASEVTMRDFPWKIETIQLGENGDALMNPQFHEIVIHLWSHIPSVKLELTTNLAHFRISRFVSVLRWKMIRSIGLNIDGHDAVSYEAQKGISYGKVMDNFKLLMKYREKYQPNLQITVNVLTLEEYVGKVRQRFNDLPIKMPPSFPHSSFKMVEDSLRKLDWITDDVFIRRSPVFFWAERGLPGKFNLSQYTCPQLPRVEREVFISPSGLWYPCCLDANQDQAYGSVEEMSLMEIHGSPARLEFIQKLHDQEFNGIGYPCDRVPFCGAVK